MNIIYVASEVVPFSKTGGLADVAGALPAEIARMGHTISVMTPYYRAVKKLEPKPKQIAEGIVLVGEEQVVWTLYQSAASKGNHSIYFIGCDPYFDRDGLYGTPKGDYEDSASRFVFFSRACLMAAQALNQPVDIWHCHDWQTALIPIYLKLQMKDVEIFKNSASVFTIHNIAYQGMFWHWDWPLLNLPWSHFNWKELEYHGKMNLLKGALVHADKLTTVSPTYAQEIQTPEYSFGMEGVLGDRKGDLCGIVNGLDHTAWNPQNDRLLPATFSADNLAGKQLCKNVLRKKMNLPDDGSAVIGMIGRLFEQKGFDLVAEALEELLKRPVQLVILGTGREEYHKLLEQVQERNPQRVAVAFAFDNGLAHLIEAGSDMFLMPSRYEPCGLNQLYSLAYGTPPIVHNVGGLADTVVDTTPETLADESATGFKFKEYTAASMLAAIARALGIFQKDKAAWLDIQTTGMSQDWSWQNSAKQYVEVYTKAVHSS